jgi:hypothetical protein
LTLAGRARLDCPTRPDIQKCHPTTTSYSELPRNHISYSLARRCNLVQAKYLKRVPRICYSSAYALLRRARTTPHFASHLFAAKHADQVGNAVHRCQAHIPSLPTPMRRGPSASCTPSLCCCARPVITMAAVVQDVRPRQPVPAAVPAALLDPPHCVSRALAGLRCTAGPALLPRSGSRDRKQTPTPLSTAGRVAHQGHGCKRLNCCRCLVRWECGWMGRQQLQH